MKIMRKIIEIDEERCDGCGLCVPACAEGSLKIVDGKVRVIAENLCDGLGACLGECPNDALHIVEREAEDFDEVAVEEHLAQRDGQEKGHGPTPVAGPRPGPAGVCPSAGVQMFVPKTACDAANRPAPVSGADSALSHWPVQIRLVPPQAPFLKGADLLVLADCAAVAYAGIQKNFIQGRVVMMGCPKFDDAQSYIDKFTEIFKVAGIRSITTVYMEVPCCAGLPFIVQKALEGSGASIPAENMVITTRGQLLQCQAATG
ncbi:MAG: 4Fe-4S binding protein [Desulfobacterales bacterium]|nr:4Fe-4S binding protein [Desulfobacterales bacterium]